MSAAQRHAWRASSATRKYRISVLIQCHEWKEDTSEVHLKSREIRMITVLAILIIKIMMTRASNDNSHGKTSFVFPLIRCT